MMIVTARTVHEGGKQQWSVLLRPEGEAPALLCSFDTLDVAQDAADSARRDLHTHGESAFKWATLPRVRIDLSVKGKRVWRVITAS